MKVLIIGGTKFIGKKLATKLVHNGDEVTIFSRSKSTLKNATAIIGDRENASDLAKLSDVIVAQQYDIAYDMCAYNEQHATDMYSIMRGHTRHIVLFSTAAVYKEASFFPLSEKDELGPHPSFGDYGTMKTKAEEVYSVASRTDNIKLTIFRPHYIFGIGDYFERHQYLFYRIDNRLPIYVPGNGQALIQFAWYDDVVEAFYRVPQVQKTREEVVNLSGDELISLNGLIEKFSRIANRQPLIEHVDYRAFNLNERRFYDDLFIFPNLNLLLCNQKARMTYHLDFKRIDEILPHLYEDWLKNSNGYSPGLEAEKRFSSKRD